MQKEKFDMLIKYVKKAFEEVTEELIDSKYELTELLSNEDNTKVAIVIGIAGNNKGRIFLESTFSTASSFTVSMNGEEVLEEPNEMYSYMAEFANMFCGRATTYINNEFNERTVWLTPPAIFSGVNLEIISPNINSEKIIYKGNHGCFQIDIGLEGGN